MAPGTALRNALFLTAFFAAITVSAGDWPQWRGPQRDGHSTDTGLLAQWPSGGPTLLWTTNGIGAGYSSGSVGNGNIFTLGDGAETSFVQALDLAGNTFSPAR